MNNMHVLNYSELSVEIKGLYLQLFWDEQLFTNTITWFWLHHVPVS